MKRLSSCILCLVILLNTAWAQTGLKQDYSVRSWTTDNGLPVNSIRDVVQTPDGFLWIATEEGLVRFDGLSFYTFDPSNNPAFADKDVHSLYLFPDSSMVIGFYKGDIISYKNLKFIRLFDRELNWIKCILSFSADPGRGLWFGTEGYGVGHLDYDGKMTWITDKEGLSNTFVQALLTDRDSSLWIGTRFGLCHLRNGKVKVYSVWDGLPDNDVRSLCFDAEGSLWIGTNGGGIGIFSDGKFSRYNPAGSGMSKIILKLFRDAEGGMWIGTNSGLYLSKNGKLRGITAGEGLSGNIISCIFQDREGNIWAGTEGNGINALRPRVVKMFTELDGLSDNSIGPVIRDPDGRIFIGTRKGALDMISSAVTEKLKKKAGLPDIPVNSLALDIRGALWIGTDGAGIYILERGKTTHLTTESGLASDVIRAVYAENDGTVWVGAGSAGIDVITNGRIDHYSGKNGLSYDQVNCFLRDRKGRMLAGTNGGGINIIAEGKISWLTTNTGLPDNVVSCMYEDADGLVWAGFEHGGLAVLENDSASIISVTDGLYADGISQIMEDSRGNFWFTSNKGIFSVGFSELLALKDNKIDRLHPRVYGKPEGMLTAECTSGVFPSGCIGTDDKIWVPTARGLAVLDVLAAEPFEDKLEVRLMRVLVNNSEVDPFQPLFLPPGTADIEFDFTSPSFLNPEKIQYKYMLEGYDRFWVNAGNRRQAYYTHIPPGNYVFKVMALGHNMQWTEEKRLFTLRIKPYFYKTSWFILPVGLIILLSVWMIVSFRIRKLREKKLRVLVEERTRDLMEEIEKRKTAQEESNAAREKLQESDRLKSSVISFLNQYFRSPVNSIMGFSELMMQGNKESSGNEMPKYIHDSGEQMLKVLDSAMLVAKLGPGENEQEKIMEVMPLLENALKKEPPVSARPQVSDSSESPSTRQPKALHGPRSGSGKYRILLVEDNRINAELVKVYIGGRYDLDVAESGEQALEMAAAAEYDAVLMDIGLPGMDGIQATAEIKKLEGYSDIPVIAVTGFTMAGMRGKIMDGGASYFLAKPFDKSMLVDLLVTVLPEEKKEKGETSDPAS
jgi:ligand-binding sensor domain-containing protein/CheY-like chemotaxis protein